MSSLPIESPSVSTTHSSTWGYVGAIVILLILFGVLIFFFIRRVKTFQELHKQKPGIRSFIGFYCPPLSSGSSGSDGCGDQNLVDSKGGNVIKCPVGYKPNIIGAYFEVYDPFQQCTSQPTQDLIDQCSATATSDYISCISPPTVGGGNWTVKACQAGEVGGCVSRDASAFLQTYIDVNCLDGDCVIPINTEAFGPLPCSGDVSGSTSSGAAPSEFGGLPLIQGSLGTGQLNSSGQRVFNNPSHTILSATNQGYYVHGVYTCVEK
jgi:hypothetical protein